MRRLLIFSLAAVSTVACLAPRQYRFVPSDPSDTLPPWHYADLIEAVLCASPFPQVPSPYWKSSEVNRAELLAWYGKVDDRPIYVNVALFWVELTPSVSGGRWALVQLGQNPIPTPENSPDSPGDRELRTKWGLYFIFDTKWEPVEIFDHPPTDDDVKMFLKNWDDSSLRWTYLTSGVRLATWERLFGSKPSFRVNSNDAG